MQPNIIQKIYDQHDVECNQKYGETLPYSFHLKAVQAQGLKFIKLLEDPRSAGKEYREEDLSIALAGHDLIEDGRMTLNDIVSLLQGQIGNTRAKFIAEIIYAVTDEKGRDRMSRKNEKYYKELKENKSAVFVKLADISANMIYSKLFNTRMYAMYKVEFAQTKAKLWSKDLAEMFEYVESL